MAIVGSTFFQAAVPKALHFIVFVLGVGTILTALSVSAALARTGLERLLKRFLPYVHRASGAMLVLAGLYISYLLGSALFAANSNGCSILAAGERFSAILKIWLVGPAGKIITLVVLALLIFTAIGFFLYRGIRKK